MEENLSLWLRCSREEVEQVMESVVVLVAGHWKAAPGLEDECHCIQQYVVTESYQVCSAVDIQCNTVIKF